MTSYHWGFKTNASAKEDDGDCLVVLSTLSFWKVVKLLKQRNTAPSLIQCIQNYELCSLDWLTEMKIYCFVTTCFLNNFRKITQVALWNFSSPSILLRPLPNNYHFKHFDHFWLRKILLTKQLSKTHLRSFFRSRMLDFYLTGLWYFDGRDVMHIMVWILISKSKFIYQNRYLIGNNLIDNS